MRKPLLDFATATLISYFSGQELFLCQAPEGYPIETGIHFAAQQFKALEQLGVRIDYARMNAFFPAEHAVDLRTFSNVIRLEEDKLRIFIDYQGSVEKPQELVAILARGMSIIAVKHLLGSNRKPREIEKERAKHVHALSAQVRHSLPRTHMLANLHQFIESNQPDEIVFYNKECRRFVEDFKDLRVQVKFRKWRERPSHYSYHAATRARLGWIGRELRMTSTNCCHGNLNYPKIFPNSVGEINRISHGANCALYGAYELMHFYLAAPETKSLTFNLEGLL